MVDWVKIVRVVRCLTETTVETVEVGGGDVRLVSEDPLLGELRLALTPSGEKPTDVEKTSGDVVGSGAPLDLEALRLLTEIEHEVNEVFWLARSAGRPKSLARVRQVVADAGQVSEVLESWVHSSLLAGRPGFGGLSLDERVQLVAGAAFVWDRPEWVSSFDGWVSAIRGYLSPLKQVPLTGHHCPVCGQVKARVPASDGELITRAALVVVFSRSEWWAQCLSCQASWSREQMVELAQALGGDVQVLGRINAL